MTVAHAAADAPATADQKAPALPVTLACVKGEATEHGGKYVLKVTNSSDKELHVKATVLWSVQSHDRAKTEDYHHKLKPGKSWDIKGLAVGDRVTLTSPGFAPVEETIQAMP